MDYSQSPDKWHWAIKTHNDTTCNYHVTFLKIQDYQHRLNELLFLNGMLYFIHLDILGYAHMIKWVKIWNLIWNINFCLLYHVEINLIKKTPNMWCNFWIHARRLVENTWDLQSLFYTSIITI
jgi:hypothetical protein